MSNATEQAAAPQAEPTTATAELAAAPSGMKAIMLQSLMTSVLTAGMTLGGGAMIATNLPTPDASPDEPAPVVTDFGQSIVEAFIADGGTPEDAIAQGASLASFGQVVALDGNGVTINGEVFQPCLNTGFDLAVAAGKCRHYAGLPLAKYLGVRDLIAAALNEHVGMGPLDDTRRANAAKIYIEAGEALLQHGEGE